MIIDEGVPRQILELFKIPGITNSIHMRKNLIWTISNCVRGKPPPDFNKIAESIPLFAAFLNDPDEDIQIECSQALYAMSSNPILSGVSLITGWSFSH